MNKIILVLLLTFVAIPNTALADSRPPPGIIPSGCDVAGGNSKDGYKLICKDLLPSKIFKWDFGGIDTIPVGKGTSYKRRIWTRNDWELHEVTFCKNAKCSPPLITIFSDESCAAT